MRSIQQLIAFMLLSVAACTSTDPAELKSFGEPATTEVSAESGASEFIPLGWQSRIHPVRTLRLDDSCVALREINGTPKGASTPGFLWQCETKSGPRYNGNATLHWLAAQTLEELSATPLTHLNWQGDVALLGERPYAFFTNKFELRLLSGNGKFETLVEPTDGDIFGFRDLSFSGRLFFRLSFQKSSQRYEVLDLLTDEVLYSADAELALYLVSENANGIQLVGSSRDPACSSDSCVPSIVILDTATNNVRRIPVPDGVGFAVPRSYGERRVVVDIYLSGTSSGRGVAVIDLDKEEVVFSGAVEDAPPSDGNLCGPLQFEGDSRDLSLPLRASIAGNSFLLLSSNGHAPTRCAITGDGRRLAIVSPPYIHIYEIGPSS